MSKFPDTTRSQVLYDVQAHVKRACQTTRCYLNVTSGAAWRSFFTRPGFTQNGRSLPPASFCLPLLSSRSGSTHTLVECVRSVWRGEQWIEQETLARAFGRVLCREAASRDAAKTLPPREIELVKMVAQGLRNRAIAERLQISEGTVKIHLHNVYEKRGD